MKGELELSEALFAETREADSFGINIPRVRE